MLYSWLAALTGTESLFIYIYIQVFINRGVYMQSDFSIQYNKHWYGYKNNKNDNDDHE